MSDGGEQSFSALVRDYEVERASNEIKRERAERHPLDGGASSKQAKSRANPVQKSNNAGSSAPTPIQDPLSSSSSSSAEGFDDPLRSVLDQGDFDPLGAMGGAPAPSVASSSIAPPHHETGPLDLPASKSSKKKSPKSSPGIIKRQRRGSMSQLALDNWSDTKRHILKSFNATGKITVAASFLTDVDDIEDSQKKVALDKTKARLEKLEEDAGEGDRMQVSQKEYVRRIEGLHSELAEAWQNSERVQALKITIQCAKLLQDTSMIQFYPSMFVMLTEILDTFGDLVYDRIATRAEESSNHDAHGEFDWARNWASTDIPTSAKETCKNWLYKTACIRELVPRLYVEMSLIRCYRFISDGAFPSILERMSKIIRGIGDPLIAAWARVYLSRIGFAVVPSEKSYLKMTALDYIFTWQQLKSETLENDLSAKGVTFNEYTRLHGPAAFWLFKAVGENAPKDEFSSMLVAYRDYCGSSLILKAILMGYNPAHWSNAAQGVVKLIKDAAESSVSTASMFEAFGEGLLRSPAPQAQRVSVLNDAWKIVTKEEDIVSYAACCAAWIEMCMKHMSEKHVLILLKDMVRHVRAAGESAVDDIVPSLERVMNCVAQTSNDFGAIVTSPYFLQLLDMFKSDQKTKLCKTLLSNFTNKGTATSDPVIIHTVFDLARGLHDSLDSLSVDDERNQISDLLCRFITQIDFGTDLEQQLNVLVDCRAAFPNLDSVKDRLILAVAELAQRAYTLVKGKHTRKTSAFVKACLAYCHITIPSIDDVLKRILLFQHCGRLALMNGCLPQTDTFFKAALKAIPDIPDHVTRDYKRVATEPMLVELFRSFASALIIVPGHPEHGPFYLAKALVKAVGKVECTTETKVKVYFALIPVLGAYTQRKLPYGLPAVESNDSLFGGNSRYIAECNDYLSSLIDGAMKCLAELAEAKDSCLGSLAIELANLMLMHCAMSKPGDVQVVRKLIKLGRANGCEGTPFYTNTMNYIKFREAEPQKAVSARGMAAVSQQRAFTELLKAL